MYYDAQERLCSLLASWTSVYEPTFPISPHS